MIAADPFAGPRRAAPPGLRWATGGGSPIGDCNGFHLAREAVHGTLCGRYGPHTPPDPALGLPICGTCARIAKVPRVVDAPTSKEETGG